MTGPEDTRAGSEPPPVEVAAAVLQRSDGAFLLAQRPPGKVYAGFWEFPGGKVEPGERPEAALARELREELGIEVRRAFPWLRRSFVYPHAAVRLNFYRVTEWRGEPQPKEDQAIAWQYPSAEVPQPMLPANAPVLAALALPWEYAITDAARFGTAGMLAMLERRLVTGLRLVGVREPGLAPRERALFTGQVLGMAHRHGARVLVKGPFPGADGVHVTAAELAAMTSRPDAPLVAASCHSSEELARAARLGLDFAVLGPVRSTTSHPHAAGIGWVRFAQMALGAAIPVYAIGGVRSEDREEAWRSGAHGLAMIRGSWA